MKTPALRYLLRRWHFVCLVLALTPNTRTAERCRVRLAALSSAISHLSHA